MCIRDSRVWSFDTGVNFSWWGFGYRDSGIRMKTERYMVEIPVLITFFESDAYIPVFLQAGVLTGILAGGRINVTADADYGEWTPRRAGDSFNRVSASAVTFILPPARMPVSTPACRKTGM